MDTEVHLTPGQIGSLFGAMAVLASLPSVSVMTVVARATSLGFRHGVFTAIGIVLGDLVLMLIALLGLAVIAETLGGLFVVLGYLGGAYLIWLGIRLWRATGAASTEGRPTGSSSAFASVVTGLAVTLGDQKAILFYLAFFPTLVDVTRLSAADLGLIVMITVVAVGGAKVIYALLAGRVGGMSSPAAGRVLNRLAGTLLIAAGLLVWVRGL